MVHEGLAIYATAELCLSDNFEDFMARAARVVGETLAPPEIAKIKSSLRDVALNERRMRGAGLATSDRRGLDAMERVVETTGMPDATWIAALAASHFPYQACDLIDMSENEFSQWVQSGGLATDVRLNRIVADPSPLKAVICRVVSGAQLTEPLMLDVLELANGGPLPNPISLDSHIYGKWERDYLWESDMASRFFARHSICPSGIGLDLLHTLDNDMTRSFLMSDGWIPPTIFLDERRVVGPNDDEAARARRRFIDAYEIERTESLLGWLSSSLAE